MMIVHVEVRVDPADLQRPGRRAIAPNALALSLRRFHRCRVLAAVDELFEPLLVKPDDEVVAVGDHGNAHTAAQSAPLS